MPDPVSLTQVLIDGILSILSIIIPTVIAIFGLKIGFKFMSSWIEESERKQSNITALDNQREQAYRSKHNQL